MISTQKDMNLKKLILFKLLETLIYFFKLECPGVMCHFSLYRVLNVTVCSDSKI